MAWGHAVSQDLVHWTHQPPALTPSPGSRDADGCFTGSALSVEGLGPVILYTGADIPLSAAQTGSMLLQQQDCMRLGGGTCKRCVLALPAGGAVCSS